MENLPFVDEIYGPIDKRRISISIAMFDHQRGATKVSTIWVWMAFFSFMIGTTYDVKCVFNCNLQRVFASLTGFKI